MTQNLGRTWQTPEIHMRDPKATDCWTLICRTNKKGFSCLHCCRSASRDSGDRRRAGRAAYNALHPRHRQYWSCSIQTVPNTGQGFRSEGFQHFSHWSPSLSAAADPSSCEMFGLYAVGIRVCLSCKLLNFGQWWYCNLQDSLVSSQSHTWSDYHPHDMPMLLSWVSCLRPEKDDGIWRVPFLGRENPRP